MQRFNRSWRWVIFRSILGVVAVFAVAAFLYPQALGWLILAALVIAGLQTTVLVAVWQKLGHRLRNAGFRW